MREKTLRAFDEWKAEPISWSELVQRVAEGETLREFCSSKKLPFSLVAKEIASDQLKKAEYDAALAIWGDSLAQESIAIVDGAKPETVGVEKLRAETRLKMAGKLDRDRYGEREGPRVAVNISLGDVAREVRELEQRLGIGAGRVLEQAPAVPALPARAEERVFHEEPI